MYKLTLDSITSTTYCRNRYFLSAVCSLLLAFLFIGGCWRPGGIGIGGRYLDAKFEIWSPRGNICAAIDKLEYVVSRDPLYRDSLTLLGRAYYKSRRYQDAFQILRRALALNREDEIAQIIMALTQLRLGDDERGLERFRRRHHITASGFQGWL